MLLKLQGLRARLKLLRLWFRSIQMMLSDNKFNINVSKIVIIN